MNIVGHEKERARLRERSTSGAPAHAYLFYGPKSIGKSACALEFASMLVGTPEFSPTPDLPHPADVLIVRPQKEMGKKTTKEKDISASAIREALRFLSTSPSSGPFRVLIIEDAERLSPGAGNALLKTLEEPNPTSVIILVSGTRGRLLPTLASRVEKVRFSFVPESEMARVFLPLFRKEKDQALLAFFLSLGRPGILFRAYQDPVFFQEVREKLGKLFRLSRLSYRERLEFSEILAEDPSSAAELLEWWLPGLHKRALGKTQESLEPRVFSYLEKVEETLLFLRAPQINSRLLLEKLFFSLP